VGHQILEPHERDSLSLYNKHDNISRYDITYQIVLQIRYYGTPTFEILVVVILDNSLPPAALANQLGVTLDTYSSASWFFQFCYKLF
jgi:hypothetical protein